jgi:hypothetical protein
MDGDGSIFANRTSASTCVSKENTLTPLELLAVMLDGNADFREVKAQEFPDDRRNPLAAEQSRQLAQQFRELDAMLSKTEYTEQLIDFVGRIGFDHMPLDAGDTVRMLIAKYQDQQWDRMAPVGSEVI